MFGMGVRDAVNVRACLIYLRVNVERRVYRDIAGEDIQFEIRLVDVIGCYLAKPVIMDVEEKFGGVGKPPSDGPPYRWGGQRDP